MRNASCQQGENERDREPKKKKIEQEHKQHFFFCDHIRHFLHKTWTRKFHAVIVQQQRLRNVQKKSAALDFFYHSCCRRLALYENIFCLSKF